MRIGVSGPHRPGVDVWTKVGGNAVGRWTARATNASHRLISCYIERAVTSAHERARREGSAETAEMRQDNSVAGWATLCGACAFGPGRLVLLTFDGDELEVEPVSRVGSDVHLVVADLNATKDTVTILRDLQMGYPRASTAIHEGVHRLLGDINARLVAAAVDAIAAGDAARLGQVYVEAQAEFDAHAAPACPAQLTAPKLHKVLQHPSLVAHVHGGKGVGSQGDGTVQFLCRGAEGAKATADVLAKDFGLTTMHVVIPASIHEQ